METDARGTKFHEYTKEAEVFGLHIKKLRENSNLSLTEIENISGLSQDYIGDLERGKRDIPSYNDIEKLAEIYNVDIKTLLSIANTRVPYED